MTYGYMPKNPLPQAAPDLGELSRSSPKSYAHLLHGTEVLDASL